MTVETSQTVTPVAPGEVDIRLLFEPRGVAVVGASSDAGKLGNRVLGNIVAGGYRGRVYPVNPRGGQLFGLPVLASVEDACGEVDVAVITVPAHRVLDVVEACGRKGVRFLVVITSGFSEVGEVELERRVVEAARSHGMRLVGPNVLGVYSSASSLNATFGPAEVLAGNLGVISQSGAIGSAMIGKTAVENLGLSAFVSVGNKADVDEADLLAYMVEDPRTRAVLLYMEGVREGRRFLHALAAATAVKPVVIIKAGRSRRGAMAAASHTGSLAGADEVFDAVVGQAGAVRAESIDEALDWCKFLVGSPRPRANSALVVTNGGGIGVLAADACERHGVEMASFTGDMARAFEGVVPPFGSVKNPVDLTGQATAEDYDDALEAALELDGVGSVVCLYCETQVLDAEALTRVVRERWAEFKERRPVVFSFFGGRQLEEAIRDLRAEGVPVFPDVYQAVSCLGALMRHERGSALAITGDVAPECPPVVREVVLGALTEGRTFLLAHEARRVVEAAGIATPRAEVARGLYEALEAAGRVGYPVAMKVVSRDIVHKTDAGGVALDLQNEGEVVDAYQAVVRRCREYDPRARIEGVEVSRMVTGGAETIVGGRRDATFGPLIMFGLGGVYVEVLKDVTFRALPLAPGELRRMVSEVRSYPLLTGARGMEQRDVEAVVSTMERVSQLVLGCELITDVELNPLVALDRGDGAVALDARILLGRPQEEIR